LSAFFTSDAKTTVVQSSMASANIFFFITFSPVRVRDC